MARASEFVVNFNNAAAFDAALFRAQLQTLTREIGPRIGWSPVAQPGIPASRYTV